MAAVLLSLAGCDRLLLTVPAELGTAQAEERSVGEVIDDLAIRIALNHIFFSEDDDLHRAVSYSVVEGRALLTGLFQARKPEPAQSSLPAVRRGCAKRSTSCR